MSDKFFVGLDITGFEDRGKRKPISRVTLLVDNDNAYTAGDDTGAELRADCPHATQAMVDSILEKVRGYQYHAYSAGEAGIDPSAELGDGVTVSGVYSVISRMDDDGSGYTGLSAPGEAELEDEYPAAGPTEQKFNLQLAQTRSQITKTAEQIRLEVSNEIEGLSAAIEVDLTEITGRVEDAEAGLSQTVRIAADGVTITNAAGSTLTIDGGQINAATIKTELLDASKINAAELNLTGVISFADLTTSLQNDVNDAYSMAQDAQAVASDVDSVVSGWTYRGTTYIDGEKLMTGTVMASYLIGGEVRLLTDSERFAGWVAITGASSYEYAIELGCFGALRLTANSGDVYIESAYNFMDFGPNGVSVSDTFYPTSHNAYDLGTSGFKWGDIYATNDVIITSDLRVKKDVVYGLERYDAFFDRLRPLSFLFTDGTSGRRHWGFGAQDVEQALVDAAMTSMDFAGFIKSSRLDGTGQVIEGEYDYALRYGEFIAMNTWQIQQLKARVAELERRIAS